MNTHRECDKYFECLIKTIECTTQNVPISDKQKEHFKEMAYKVCANEWKCARMQLIAEAANEFNHSIDELNESIEKEKTKPTPPAEQLDRYVRFLRDMNAICGNLPAPTQSSLPGQSDNDDFIMKDVINEIDPITKGPLRNPVRNIKCNHIYGKDSVTCSLQENPRLRCPILGCSNQEFVKLSDLVDDLEYAAKAMQQQRLNREQEDLESDL